MSRIANNPVGVPEKVEVTLSGQELSVKGAKGQLKLAFHEWVEVSQEENVIKVRPTQAGKKANTLAGTYRSIIDNMVTGVDEGFEKGLELQGVGYRAQMKGSTLSLTLGFSHPVEYLVPEGVQIETPSQTQIVVRGIDKQQVGQVAAEIRAFRPPEPYKGKGVRYANENVKRKEAKKK
ncbi:MAG: 50S ribosomal protein L6 [Gammaproteobacteria bacterium]|jgi:large subunit ribosomal protein L6|nr:50S ribosomal protein L6 [Gammaproteobacteria bacterium]|tara:strand:- start:167 stop:700 length:534 start_codon:yes stop_codon:yes gene_type:complete